MEVLVEAVKQWGRDHNITNPFAQYTKVVEEVGEIAHELTRDNLGTLAMEDAIGDTLVTVIILADIVGIDPMMALSNAYNNIKDRKGHTVEGGNFVKEEQ